MDPKIAALLAYLFGWIGGLIMFFTQKHPEVRFHAAQSIILSVAATVVYILLTILSAAAGFGGFFLLTIIVLLFWLGTVALFIYLMIQGYNLKHVKIPVAGDMAEKWAMSQT
jgi:uncharacterized membrane protein